MEIITDQYYLIVTYGGLKMVELVLVAIQIILCLCFTDWMCKESVQNSVFQCFWLLVGFSSTLLSLYTSSQ